MNLINELTKLITGLKELLKNVDDIEFHNIRYRQEIKYLLTLKPELKDFFSDATKEEAGVDISGKEIV